MPKLSDISSIKIGSTNVTKVMFGSTQVWGAGSSPSAFPFTLANPTVNYIDGNANGYIVAAGGTSHYAHVTANIVYQLSSSSSIVIAQNVPCNVTGVSGTGFHTTTVSGRTVVYADSRGTTVGEARYGTITGISATLTDSSNNVHTITLSTSLSVKQQANALVREDFNGGNNPIVASLSIEGWGNGFERNGVLYANVDGDGEGGPDTADVTVGLSQLGTITPVYTSGSYGTPYSGSKSFEGYGTDYTLSVPSQYSSWLHVITPEEPYPDGVTIAADAQEGDDVGLRTGVVQLIYNNSVAASMTVYQDTDEGGEDGGDDGGGEEDS